MSEGGRQVGFVGVGTIGKPMALNLLKGGYALTVFDLNKAAVVVLNDFRSGALGRITLESPDGARAGAA